MNQRDLINHSLVLIILAAMLTSLGCQTKSTTKPTKQPAKQPAKKPTKQPTKKSPIVGTWELASTSRRGPRTRTLTINEDLTGVYQGRNREFPVTDIKLEGNQLSFNVHMQWREREFLMEFKGTLDGSTLKGQWLTSIW